jgi:hypothetical protein
MFKFRHLSAALAAAAAFGMTVPAAHAETPSGEAAKLRRLDIMLMVSSLRCRFGADNFQDDYVRFSTNQNASMQAAFQTLQADYTARMGATGAKKALDTLSVSMANQYGQGHPWLGCGELKAMTQDLAGTSERTRLLAAADAVLDDRPNLVALASAK